MRRCVGIISRKCTQGYRLGQYLSIVDMPPSGSKSPRIINCLEWLDRSSVVVAGGRRVAEYNGTSLAILTMDFDECWQPQSANFSILSIVPPSSHGVFDFAELEQAGLKFSSSSQ